jgi:hypothetical protein
MTLDRTPRRNTGAVLAPGRGVGDLVAARFFAE